MLRANPRATTSHARPSTGRSSAPCRTRRWWTSSPTASCRSWSPRASTAGRPTRPSTSSWSATAAAGTSRRAFPKTASQTVARRRDRGRLGSRAAGHRSVARCRRPGRFLASFRCRSECEHRRGLGHLRRRSALAGASGRLLPMMPVRSSCSLPLPAASPSATAASDTMPAGPFSRHSRNAISQTPFAPSGPYSPRYSRKRRLRLNRLARTRSHLPCLVLALSDRTRRASSSFCAGVLPAQGGSRPSATHGRSLRGCGSRWLVSTG